MVRFAEISKAPPPYSILQHVEWMAAAIPYAKKLFQILVNNIDNWGGGLVSEFMWGIVALSWLNICCKNWLRLSERITYI